MLHIPSILTKAMVDEVRAIILAADWGDGRQTAGHVSAHAKRNRQLSQSCPAAIQAGRIIAGALGSNATFISGALPHRIMPPIFNRYGSDENYGAHVDGAIQTDERGERIRSDLAATLFLTDPAEYDGGTLLIRAIDGVRSFKLPAGDMIVYSASSIHEVTAVTRGERVAAIFWMQSIIREHDKRHALFELDNTIQTLTGEGASQSTLLSLTCHYHNLIRFWADA